MKDPKMDGPPPSYKLKLVKPTEPGPCMPLDGPALRVTETECLVDGGAFVLSLKEFRPVREYRLQERFADGNSAYVELGRFMLSPITFVYLKRTLEAAEKWYCDHFGDLPDPDKHKAALAAEVGLPFVEPAPSADIGFRKR